jgi:transcriptional regulator with XRE-family HTH domain
MSITKPLLAQALISARETDGLTVRELARRADISHTQVSRIESGQVATPSRDVLVRLAKALERNPGPFLVLAGHFREGRARLVLAPMFRAGAELPEEWPDDAQVPLAEAIATVSDPRSTQAALMRVAAAVIAVPETDETLWDPSHVLYQTTGESEDELELLGIWRYVRDRRRSDFLNYGRALRELEDLDYLVERDRMELAGHSLSEPVAATPPVPGFERAALEDTGFSGFQRASSLEKGCSHVPESAGVYIVMRVSEAPVRFLEHSVGGRHKGRDPSLTHARLASEWVDGAQVVYIGSAGNLRRRVDELARFGRGEPIGHWGGRALWQLADHADLIVAWWPAQDPVGHEAALLAAFIEQYDRLPFANLRTVKR